MTFKCRLILSNLLLVFLPILLVLLFSALSLHLLSSPKADPNANLYDGIEALDEFASQNPQASYADLEAWVAAFEAKHPPGPDAIILDLPTDQDPNPATAGQKGMGQGRGGSPMSLQQMEAETVSIHRGQAAYAQDFDSHRLILFQAQYGQPQDQVSLSLQHFIKKAGLPLLLALVAFLILGNLLVTRSLYRAVTKPLAHLSQGMSDIEEGLLDTRLPLLGDREFKQAAEDFNAMASYVQRAIKENMADHQHRQQALTHLTHHLRTPLTTASTYAQALQDGLLVSQEDNTQAIDAIRQACAAMEASLNELSRPQGKEAGHAG